MRKQTCRYTTLLPVLYSFRRCPYAMRARLALLASGQRVELREVVLRDKPQALIAASPKATVPVLVMPDGQVIDQSLDIMLWALQRNDPLGWLVSPAGDVAAMLTLVHACDQGFKPLLDGYKYPQRGATESGVTARDAGARFLVTLQQRLAAQPFLFGPHATLADMAIAPFVRQFAGVDAAWFDAMPWPALQAWLRGWEGSALMARTMCKFAPWRPGEVGPVFGP